VPLRLAERRRGQRNPPPFLKRGNAIISSIVSRDGYSFKGLPMKINQKLLCVDDKNIAFLKKKKDMSYEIFFCFTGNRNYNTKWTISV
jgi:hypothetical protein